MKNAASPSVQHRAGYVLSNRGDNLHWLQCVDCGREWAEKDSGAYARGSKVCRRVSRRADRKSTKKSQKKT